MYCEECQKRPANVHLTKIINGNKIEKKLCDKCALKAQDQLGIAFESQFPFPNILGSILQSEGFSPLGNMAINNTTCDKCNLTYQQFAQAGRMGCEKCYEYFGDRLKHLLKRVHRATSHTGKVPKRSGKKIRLKQEIEKLKVELQQSVYREEFEKAAEIRDVIKELEGKLQGE